MKVVYRSIIKEIEKAIETADKAERTIEMIRLSPQEWSDYMMETTSPITGVLTDTESWYRGHIKIVKGGYLR